jgi:ABC-type Fe2+-enterobactin transport system substrate-binding protein
MPWWLIVIGVIIAGLLLDNLLYSKKRKEKEVTQFLSGIQASSKRKIQEDISRLQPEDEKHAQRIKKLFYSAAYHESRNVTAFHNILKELSQIRKEILLAAGTERMTTITNRVEYLCGNDMMGFREYLAIFRYVNESTAIK